MVIFPSNKEEDGGRRKPGMRNKRGEINGYTLRGETQNQTHKYTGRDKERHTQTFLGWNIPS